MKDFSNIWAVSLIQDANDTKAEELHGAVHTDLVQYTQKNMEETTSNLSTNDQLMTINTYVLTYK